MAKGKKIAAHVPTKVGIASFSETEFALLKQVAIDRDRLDDTFEYYRANIERVKKTLSKKMKVVEVPVTVAEIEAYCRENQQENTGETRARMVRDILEKNAFGPAKGRSD